MIIYVSGRGDGENFIAVYNRDGDLLGAWRGMAAEFAGEVLKATHFESAVILDPERACASEVWWSKIRVFSAIQ